MDKDEILQATEKFVREKMEGEGSGHDWWHVDRVRKSALTISKAEGADLFIVELGALMHDIADWKFSGELTANNQATREFFGSLNVDEKIIDQVAYIAEHVSYKGAGEENGMEGLEGMIVQDADRLDALGAIGIARTFAYGGYKGREIYNPNFPPETHATFDDYKKSTGHSINHFYEKLLLLKDRMNTKTGKQMAEQRHQYMENYLKEFYSEWNGEI